MRSIHVRGAVVFGPAFAAAAGSALPKTRSRDLLRFCSTKREENGRQGESLVVHRQVASSCYKKRSSALCAVLYCSDTACGLLSYIYTAESCKNKEENAENKSISG